MLCKSKETSINENLIGTFYKSAVSALNIEYMLNLNKKDTTNTFVCCLMFSYFISFSQPLVGTAILNVKILVDYYD